MKIEDLDKMILVCESNDVLESLLSLRRTVKMNEEFAAYDAAILKFQSQCPQIKKSSKAHKYKYAKHEEVMAVVQKHLTECGITVQSDLTMRDGIISCTTYISAGGYTKEFSAEIPFEKLNGMNDAQASGAAQTYAKRYALCAALNIVVAGEDNDMNAPVANAKTGEITSIGGMDVTELVTNEQAAEIGALAAQAGVTMSELLSKVRGARGPEDIPASKYNAFVSALNKKIEAQQ